MFCFEAFVNHKQKNVQVGVIFNKKYIYRCLSAINNNVDSVNFQYNMDNKTYMNSSAINIFIGAYQQSTAMLILPSILSIFDIIWTIKHTCRVTAINICIGA